MIGLLVVTHGAVARELVDAARRIVQSPGNIAAVAIDWDQEVDAVRAAIDEAIRGLDQGEGVILATDMFGGTPTNIALTFLEPGRIEVVTGVNLPMVIKYTNLETGVSVREAATLLASRGRSAISVAGEILSHRAESET
ncbi:MAG: PTS fructose transporter subunit IIA [Acidobacteria bacterium]|nr:PTS fructose transporter subunit IIA [Acidobacteriota bacterium]